MHRALWLLVLLLFAPPALAQEAPPEGCAASDYAAILTDAQGALGKPDADLDPLVADLITTLLNQRAHCAGFAFGGAGGEVIGPLDLSAGDYIVDVTLETGGTVTAEGLDQECESAFTFFLLSSFDMAGGADSGIIRLDSDCRVLLDVGSPGTWTLTLTKVN